jgi:hypothetical protein
MSGDDVRVRTASSAAAPSDDLCDKRADVAKCPGYIGDAMTGVLRTRMQTGQI